MTPAQGPGEGEEDVDVCCCDDPRRPVMAPKCDACRIGLHARCTMPSKVRLGKRFEPYRPGEQGARRPSRMCHQGRGSMWESRPLVRLRAPPR